MIDQVLSHTSIEHAWFRESRQDRSNPKADWYVWADPREDGTPPNNWLSLFGGGAWQWEPRREQYYLHNFLVDQPDLNFHHPDVQQATLDNVRFWLDRGVDGFRLDAINFCFHDAQLRDNPPKPADKRVGRGFSPDNPYAYQYHYYNNTQPENLPFLERLRALLDAYPGALRAAGGRLQRGLHPRHGLAPGSGDDRRLAVLGGFESRRGTGGQPLGRPSGRPAPGADAGGDAVLAAWLGLPVPGRGAGPGRGRGAVRGPAGPLRHHLLAELQGP
ncbi:hypothetical protein G6F35_013702 [Rhizopus arrhizus]|nr:hypothetical protein G6F35_013702 [Rhizopus arrhizus]